MSSLNQLPLILEMGALELNFQGTPQQFADAIVARMRVVSQQALALFAAGATEPAYNVGPWLDQSSTIGIWKGFSNVTGNYQPLPVADVTLKYILSSTEPNPSLFQLWVKLSPAGEGLGVYTYYNGAWRDVYASVIATLQAAIAAVIPTTGPAGEVLTSAGPGVPPIWSRDVYPGMMVPYGGATSPNVRFHLADGSLKLIDGDTQLFNAYGTIWGGDGITTFGLPDYRGRGFVGVGTSPDAVGATPWAVGQKKGAETHLLTTPELPITTGNISTQRIVADGNVANAGGGIMGFASGSLKALEPFGGDQPHNNVQPSAGCNVLIYRY